MNMKLTREQRMLNVISRKEVDYLPSNIAFSDVTRIKNLGLEMGFLSTEKFQEFMDNHLSFILLGIDAPIVYRNDVDMMETLRKKGLCGVDLEERVVYDPWGVGIKMDIDGFFPCYHPLQQKFDQNKRAVKFIPDSFNKKILEYDDAEQAIHEFVPPDALNPANFEDAVKRLSNQDGESLYAVCGYGGIFERAYHIMGFEELMMGMVAMPEAVHELLGKITDHKIRIAKKAVELGARLGHIGDDLGTQQGLIFSKEMFKEFYKPLYKEVFEVYHKANVPIMMHSCGNIIEILPELIDIGLTILEPVQPTMDLAYLKREFGKDLIFYGGIDTQQYLPYMTPDQTREMVRNTIYTLGMGGGYIVAPAQEITVDVPVENIKALIETVLVERERVLDL